jgi:hypothetical protein
MIGNTTMLNHQEFLDKSAAVLQIIPLGWGRTEDLEEVLEDWIDSLDTYELEDFMVKGFPIEKAQSLYSLVSDSEEDFCPYEVLDILVTGETAFLVNLSVEKLYSSPLSNKPYSGGLYYEWLYVSDLSQVLSAASTYLESDQFRNKYRLVKEDHEGVFRLKKEVFRWI